MKNTIEYDFIPQEISIAIFKNNCGFISCKYRYESWRNVGIFERLCGFKPHLQRDPAKQLKKAIFNAVDVIDNKPVTGFKFIDYDEDLYSIYFNDCSDIVLQDPRGFNVAITKSNFYYMLNCCNNSMTNRILDHKFVYAWSKSGSRFMLVDAETAMFEKCRNESDLLKNKIDNHSYITKKQLVIGKIYQGTEKFPGKHMYLGEMEVYDNKYHEKALVDGLYTDINEYIKNKPYSDITNLKRLVFYTVEKSDKANSEYPFIFKSSISKIIESEIDFDLDGCYMFNDSSKKLSFEAIREYMDTCFLFNKIELASIKSSASSIPYDIFNEAMNRSYYTKNKTVNTSYPFFAYDIYNSAFLVSPTSGKTYANSLISIDISRSFSYNYITNTSGNKASYKIIKNDNSNFQYYYNSRNVLDTIIDTTIQDVYNILKPMVYNMKLQNGNLLPIRHSIIFQRFL